MANEIAWRLDRRRRSMCATSNNTRAEVVYIALTAVDRSLTYECPSCRQVWTVTDLDAEVDSLKAIRIA